MKPKGSLSPTQHRDTYQWHPSTMHAPPTSRGRPENSLSHPLKRSHLQRCDETLVGRSYSPYQPTSDFKSSKLIILIFKKINIIIILNQYYKPKNYNFWYQD